jgi:hypothetical protein
VKAKTPVSNRSDEETDEPLIANDRNYYKVEKWTKDGSKVERMLYAGSNLDKAREVLRRGHLPSATYPADYSAAVACAGGVAEGGAIAAAS